MMNSVIIQRHGPLRRECVYVSSHMRVLICVWRLAYSELTYSFPQSIEMIAMGDFLDHLAGQVEQRQCPVRRNLVFLGVCRKSDVFG